ncbi:MAG: ankyrin repeat domain-containing protein, partial [Planctomycetia bacterium]|nr:ankyrin repeat domain-containing protein [Planctomycetia bacterium]
MPRPHSAPTRTLPARPNLAQLRKQAKDLLKAYKAGHSAAAAEIGRFEESPDPTNFALADAQRVLARAYGFPSWTALKQHVDGFNITAFCEAVEAGDVATVRRLARARPDLASLSSDGEQGERIPLHAAVLKRDVEMTRVLMELGSDARKGIWPHRSATTAYAIAKDRAYDEIVAIIEREEERRRKETSSPGATVSSKIDDIHKAILQDRCAEAINILESDLSLVGACSLFGATPLHVAAWTHNTGMMAWLLDHGARVDAEAQFDVPLGASAANVPGKTPLDYAAIVAGWSAHGRHFSYLENSAKGPQGFDQTASLLRARGAKLTLRAAVATGDGQAVRQMHQQGKLLNEIHHLRGGLLSIAVRVNRPDMVSLLLDLGLDPDETVPGEDGTPLSWGMPLWFTAMCGRPEIAELLLARGADVNAIVFASGDALGIAGDTGDGEMQALLRKHGARITVEQVAGERDLKTAQSILDGTLKAYSLNIDEPTLTDLAEPMLWAAAGSEEIVRMCLPHITRKRDDPWWNSVLLSAKLPDGLKLILEHGVDPDVRGDEGYTV